MMLKKNLPLLFAVLAVCILVAALYPFCKYYVDPDATAYLVISKRYADGDFIRAINGYWSPLACWLTSLGIKMGLEVFLSGVFVNTTAVIGFLFISDSFFKKFELLQTMRWWLLSALTVFLSFAVYYQSFDDLWECFLLLSCLRILLHNQFLARPALWIAYGIVGALAYFAKAYSFPFFIINTIVCVYFISKNNRLKWLKVVAISLCVMFVCATPWIFLLHQKYGQWFTSTAGSMNLSWYLVGHPYYRQGIDLLLPPTYANSINFWEDPYLVNGFQPHFWDSLNLFVLQLIRIVYNFFKLISSMNDISAFMLPVSVFTVIILFSKKLNKHFTEQKKIVAISFLLFPVGFLLINFEVRYIWYMLPLAMLLGALALQYLLQFLENRFLKLFISLAFAASFICFPAWNFRMITEGKNDFYVAQFLKQSGIKGSFTSNAVLPYDRRSIARLTWFSGNSYYAMANNNYDSKKLLQEIRRYKIGYFFYFYNGINTDFVLKDENGNSFPEIAIPTNKTFKVFVLSTQY